MKKRTVYALVGLVVFAAIGTVAWFVQLRPRPSRLSVTTHVGDDTVVVNQMRPSRLGSSVLDQYGRRLHSDTLVQYQWIAGDSIPLSPDGIVRCEKHGDTVVRAAFESLSREFVIRCRPVASIEATTTLDLMVGDSARDLAFVAHGPDGRVVTELRGAITIDGGSIVAAQGTSVRPKRSGGTIAIVEVGDAKAVIQVIVYQPVKSFVGNPQGTDLMAMHVNLARGDTIEVPLPKAAFWVTYFSKDPSVPPPTIELQGDGSCTTGDGLHLRRIQEGEYAKYCHTGNGARMMVAHGATGAAIVNGVVAIRLLW